MTCSTPINTRTASTPIATVTARSLVATVTARTVIDVCVPPPTGETPSSYGFGLGPFGFGPFGGIAA